MPPFADRRNPFTITELLGAHEAAELLGLARQALYERRKSRDFPEPIAALAAGPVWSRAQLVEYARVRAARFHERPAIEELARDEVSVEEAAEILDTTPAKLRAVARGHVGMPGRWRLGTDELLAYRAAGSRPLRSLGAVSAETAVIG